VTSSLPVPRIVPGDVDVLERRAREIAGGGAAEDAATAGLLRLVSFRLRGRPCAVDASIVERALVIAAPFPVPLSDGSERSVAFVEERPIPVADLAGAATGTERRAVELAGAPALVVGTVAGSVAIAVEGPLELAEDRLAASADGAVASERDVKVAGRLAGGAALVDGAWLLAWAGKVART